MSVILFVLGIASLIGSKLGGFLADRTGTARTLVISMIPFFWCATHALSDDELARRLN